jgi:putative heme-binding domain-containing protein
MTLSLLALLAGFGFAPEPPRSPSAAGPSSLAPNADPARPKLGDHLATSGRFRLPRGFTATAAAEDGVATNISALAVDPSGAVFVSGPGYLRRLVDADGDGRFESAAEVAPWFADGAMGLLVETEPPSTRPVTGPAARAAGLTGRASPPSSRTIWFVAGGMLGRLIDRDGDGLADGPAERILTLKTGVEHGAHAVRRGPDGRLHVLCGNDTGIGPKEVTDPGSPITRPIAGCLLRLSEDLKRVEVIADGLRNPYDVDFLSDGRPVTWDSDNERCIGLPWYEGCRLLVMPRGGHFGWQNPQRGVTWRMPPDLPGVIAPAADLGRGSPTGVCRHHHPSFGPEWSHPDGVFLLDWTFGRIWHAAMNRGSNGAPKATVRLFLEPAEDEGFAPTAVRPDPTTGDLLVSIGGRGTRGGVYRIRGPGVRASADTALSPAPSSPSTVTANRANGNPDPRLLGRCGYTDRELLERRRGLTGAALAGFDREAGRTPAGRARLRLEAVDADAADVNRLIAEAISGFPATDDPAARLLELRVLQRGVGDLFDPKTRGLAWEGYSRGPSRADLKPVIRFVAEAFPTNQPAVDRELIRLAAQLRTMPPGFAAALVARMTDASAPADDIHALIALARLEPAPAEKHAPALAGALLKLDGKLERLGIRAERNWNLRLREIVKALAEGMPALRAALVESPALGEPEHAPIVEAADLPRPAAARRFLAKARENPSYEWSAEVVRLVGALPEEDVAARLRGLWDEVALRPSLVGALTRRPRQEDRGVLLEALELADRGAVEAAAGALIELETKDPRTLGLTEVPALIRALGLVSVGPAAGPARQRLGALLERVTEQRFGADEAKWTDWLGRSHPELAKALRGRQSVDWPAWQRRLGGVDWGRGDARRGELTFRRLSCAACHAGRQAVGPALTGVTGRFSREDLFRAMIEPDRDVADRYRATLFGLDSGEVHKGIIIYEANDGVLLQVSAERTIRLKGSEIDFKSPTRSSLMPANLLDKSSDLDLADLDAYLKTLGKK